MNKIKLTLALLAAGISAGVQRFFKPDAIVLENTLNVFATESAAYLSDSAVSRFKLLKVGTDANHAGLCGVGDIPLGWTPDEASAAEKPLAVNFFGVCKNGLSTASGAITLGDLLVPGANGTIRTLPVTSGSYYICGRALKGVADGVDVPFIPFTPVLRVV